MVRCLPVTHLRAAHSLCMPRHQLRIAAHMRKISICCRYVKAAASVLLVLSIITAAANVWCLGPINQQYIPQAVRQAEIALERKVRLTGMMAPMLAVPQQSAVSLQSLSKDRLCDEAGCNFCLVSLHAALPLLETALRL